MLKTLIYLLLVQNSFISEITKDFKRNSQFLVVNVNYRNKLEHAVIENDNLFLFFAITNNITQQEYPEFILNILSKNQPIMISNEAIRKYDFHIITSKINYSKKEILKKYFNRDGVIKSNIDAKRMYDLISNLFKHNTSCHIDSETGYLVIDNL